MSTGHPILVLVHIPKTAGTTLHKILVHQAGAGGVMVRHDADGPPSEAFLSELAARSRRGPLTVVGHQSVGLHRHLPGVRYVTCLRHPLERLVSHYHHARNDPAHYLHAAIHQHGWDVADYVESGLSGELSNGMVRMLAGVEDFHHAVPDRDTLAIALDHLEHRFDAIIPSARFDEGVLALARRMHWPPPYYIRRKVGRKSGAGAKVNADQERRILARNELDWELYRQALERFENTMADERIASADMEQFRRANRLAGGIVYLARELRWRMRADSQNISHGNP
jgi:hypothetical protein